MGRTTNAGTYTCTPNTQQWLPTYNGGGRALQLTPPYLPAGCRPPPLSFTAPICRLPPPPLQLTPPLLPVGCRPPASLVNLFKFTPPFYRFTLTSLTANKRAGPALCCGLNSE